MFMANVLKTIRIDDNYESLRDRYLKIYLFGEIEQQPVDHMEVNHDFF